MIVSWDDPRVPFEHLYHYYDTSNRPIPGQVVPCLLCKKPFLMRWYIGTPDQLCPECHKAHDQSAKIVCIQCNMVIARIYPEILDSGFKIQSRSTLHCDKCIICDPDVEYSRILEIDRYERLVGRQKTIISIRLESGSKT